MSAAPASKVRGAWRIFCRCCRWARILLVFLVLAVVCSLTYFSEVGLPGFIKRPIIESLQNRGVELEFSKLRWRWFRGFVAEDVRAGSATNSPGIPLLSLREADLEVDHSQLHRFRYKVDALNLRGGTLSWPLVETNGSGSSIVFSNIEARLVFRPDDEWELDHFSASYKGARLNLSADILNASSLKDWPMFRHRGSPVPGSFAARLRRIAEVADRVAIQAPSQINMIVHGDALNPSGFDAFFILRTPAVDTPWCHVTNADMFLRLNPPAMPGGPSRLEWRLGADSVETEYATVQKIHANLQALGDDQLTNLVRARLELSASNATTSWATSGDTHISAHWAHSLTNPMPSEGVVQIIFTNITTPWANASGATLAASLQTPAIDTPQNPAWGFWDVLSPYVLALQAEVKNISAEDFQSGRVVFSGGWKAPFLEVTNLYTEMYQGRFKARAFLDVETRRARLAGVSDFDALKAYPLLPPAARAWLDKQHLAWEKPPQVKFDAGMTLPAWTNHHPDWKAEALPSATLDGEFQLGGGSCRGVGFDAAGSHVSYAGQAWSLPDLVVQRPEGALRLAFESDGRTGDFHFKINSRVDPKAARPALDEKGRLVMDKFQLGSTPHLTGDLWGRWREPESIGFKGHLAATNLSYKGETATAIEADVAYTNRFVLLTHGHAERGGEIATADSFGMNFKSMTGHLTNGFSTIDPMVVGRLIGTQTAQSLQPYHFLKPPTVSVYGDIPLSEDISVSDLHFKIDGGAFEWWKFHVPRISGLAHWRGDELMLDDMDAGFYNGGLKGRAHFDFDTEDGTDFSFDINVSNASLEPLMADVSTVTNKYQGGLSGHLLVSRANTANPLSWFGSGHASLTNGLIWQIPIFGVLSPALNVISPGLGESRIGEGNADFVITNSVIRTENLVVRSPSLRLLYKGTVSFDFKVDAEVEAEIGRDTPVVGSLVSVLFMPVEKLFKTRVTGTLRDPKREPVLLLTRMISPLLHPWRIFSIFSPKSPETPPETKPDKPPAAPETPAGK